MRVLKVQNYQGYDAYHIPLEDRDETWQEVLDYIEGVLDEQYNKHDTMIGVKIDAEIIEMTQAEVDVLLEER